MRETRRSVTQVILRLVVTVLGVVILISGCANPTHYFGGKKQGEVWFSVFMAALAPDVPIQVLIGKAGQPKRIYKLDDTYDVYAFHLIENSAWDGIPGPTAQAGVSLLVERSTQRVRDGRVTFGEEYIRRYPIWESFLGSRAVVPWAARQQQRRRRTAALRRAREKRTEEKAITPSRKVWRTAGSGFILRGTSYVLTSYHVFQKGVSIRVTLPSGEVYPALVVTKDRNNDLALVQLKGMRPMGGFIAQLQAEVKTGELVHALGYPLGERLSRQPSIVTGYVSAGTGLEDNIAQFRMTTPINEGNSGGPIVNAQGTLVGIASSGLVQQGVEGIRFGTKISAAMLVLQQARLVRKFTIMAVPKERKVLTPPEIFREYSPYVVLIETR